MIPRDYITEWRAHAPWVQDFQVEQDLVISRALVAIFGHPLLAASLAFRGGTALYKLHLKPAARYSEDIDLVQINAEPAGPIMSALRSVLDSLAGRTKMEADGRPRYICLPVRLRGRATAAIASEGGNQLTGALIGLRSGRPPILRLIALVRG